jgi:hypothetical protein
LRPRLNRLVDLHHDLRAPSRLLAGGSEGTQRDPHEQQRRGTAATAGALKPLVTFNAGLQAAILAAAIGYGLADRPDAGAPAVVEYQYSYGPHPFRPSQTETSTGRFVPEREIADSVRCLSCHAEIGEQWIRSAHRQAASDAAYVTNVSLLADKKGISATRYCEGCHAPVALLSGQLSPTGERIFASGRVGEDRNVDPQAHFYRSLPVDRTGQLVWRHDLFRMVGESFRRVIAAGESDVVEYAFRVPAWAKSPLTVTATLKYRKLNVRYARWALKDQYAPLPVVDLAWDSLAIPVEIRKRVEPAVSAPSGSDSKPEPERTASRARLAP